MNINELKKIAEKKMRMSWDEIMKQADRDTAEQTKRKDPIAMAHKKASVSPKKMFKDSMNSLDKINNKKV